MEDFIFNRIKMFAHIQNFYSGVLKECHYALFFHMRKLKEERSCAMEFKKFIKDAQ